jgi:glycerophosphoryl diester phosphodiesterase
VEKAIMLVVGHRGAPDTAPENTLAAFEAAIAVGVDAIELDVHLSRDGHLVVIHDDKLERTTNGAGLVHERTLAELRALDAGGWFAPAFAGERIPTFDEALETIGRRAALQVEIKGKTDGVSEATVAALTAHGLLDGAMLTSFHLDRLPLVRSLAPGVEIGALVWGRTRDGRPMTPEECVAATRRAEAGVMLLWHEWLDEAMMAAGTSAGLLVGAAGGTATEADIRRLVRLGAARMTSNFPGLCRAVVDQIRRG